MLWFSYSYFLPSISNDQFIRIMTTRIKGMLYNIGYLYFCTLCLFLLHFNRSRRK